MNCTVCGGYVNMTGTCTNCGLDHHQFEDDGTVLDNVTGLNNKITKIVDNAYGGRLNRDELTEVIRLASKMSQMSAEALAIILEEEE